MIDKILQKWNIVYAIIFVVGSALFVDIWESLTSISLLLISIGILITPPIKSVVNWVEES